jgi:hypothetical protein
MSNIFNKTKFILIFCFFLSISGCGLYQKSDARKVPVNAKERAEQNVREGKGFSLMDIGKKGSSGTYEFATSNPLWRASLDILDFTPFSNVDYSGGIIITDWFANESIKNNSLKITIKFLSNEIRADGLDVIIYEKNCTPSKDCNINKLKSNVTNEIRLAILKKATILEKQMYGKKKKLKGKRTPE